MRLNRMNAPAACYHFSIFSFLYQRAKPPQGTVLFINLLGKGLTQGLVWERLHLMGSCFCLKLLSWKFQHRWLLRHISCDVMGALFPSKILPFVSWYHYGAWLRAAVSTADCLAKTTNVCVILAAAIFLSSLKLPHHEVKRLILNCDQTVLTESAINSLLKYLPSPEQVGDKLRDICSCVTHRVMAWLKWTLSVRMLCAPHSKMATNKIFFCLHIDSPPLPHFHF